MFRFFIFFTLLVSAQFAFGRTWTDSLGRQFEGELIRVEGEQVFLKVSGLQRSFKFSQLSSSDQRWLSRGGGAPAPTAASSTKKEPKRSSFTPSGQGQPKQINIDQSVPVTRIETNPAEKRWVYASPNFEFVCNKDLGLAKVREFVWMFEGVWSFCEQWPVHLPRLQAREQVRMRTLLVETEEDYVRLGGPPGSAGVYMPARDLVLIPFSSLRLDRGRRGRQQEYVLRHEITHQLMKGQTQQAAWFIEGSAEYVASVPFAVNRVLADKHSEAVVDFLIARNVPPGKFRSEGRMMKLTSLEKFMTNSYSGFQRTPLAYPYGLVVFYYFAKLDGNKDGASLRAYVDALHRDKSEAEARKLLLRGRSWDQLEADMTRAWGLKGLKLKFTDT